MNALETAEIESHAEDLSQNVMDNLADALGQFFADYRKEMLKGISDEDAEEIKDGAVEQIEKAWKERRQ